MPNEKIIQITEEQGYITALTNQGRIFISNGKSANSNLTWNEVVLPPLNKTKPRAQAKSEGYSEEFESLWRLYALKGKGNKQDAARQYWNRRSEANNEARAAYIHEEIVYGIKAYIKFIEATGQSSMQFCRFVGNSKHYLNDYTIPEQVKRQNAPKLPMDDNKLERFAIDNNLPRPGRGESAREYRVRLQTEITNRG